MSTFLLEFSPTGGTKAVLEVLSKAFVVDARVDLSKAEEWHGVQFSENDVCLIGMPSFGGRAPAVALDRLRQFRGGGARAVLVAVYGNRDFEDTLLEMKDVATECGFRPVAAVSAVAEHSIMRQYGKGRPDGRDRNELRQFGLDIKQDLEDHPDKRTVQVPGHRPYRKYNGVPLKPTASKACISCGLCVAKCPVGAIPKERPFATDRKKCISCMRCVDVCTVHARRVNPVLLRVASEGLKKACKTTKKNKLYL